MGGSRNRVSRGAGHARGHDLQGWHYVLFVLGFFIPLLWLIGALIAPTEAAARREVAAGP